MTPSKEILLERGRAANKRGRHTEAARDYDAVLAVDQHCAEAWNGKASALEKQGLYSDAIAAYDEARACNPARYGESALFSMGNCHASLGDKPGAVRCYNGVIELNPRAGRRHNRGIIVRTGPRRRGVSFSRAAQVGGDVSSWVWNAHCLSRLKQIAEAERSANRAEQSGDNAAVWKAWLQVATYEFYRNNSSSVLAAADRALKVDPEAGPAWLFRGMGLARLGQTAEALQLFDRAIAI
jgi:tetratricopeptide (TPR) repeat protein